MRKGGGGDVEALALAVPTDALSEPAPEDLVSLESGAMDAFDAAGSKDWQTAWAIVEEMKAAAEIVVEGSVPDRLGPQLDAALRELAAAVRKQDAAAARQAAIDVARWSLDLQLRHRPVAEVELARFDLWAAQMLVDVEARNVAGVNGDFFSLDYIRDRVQQTLSEEDLARLNLLLEELNGAVGDADLPTVARGARELRDMVAGFSA